MVESAFCYNSCFCQRQTSFNAFSPPNIETYSLQIGELIFSRKKAPKTFSILFNEQRTLEKKVKFIPKTNEGILSAYPWLKTSAYVTKKPLKDTALSILHVENNSVNAEEKFTIVFSHSNFCDLGTVFPFLFDVSSMTKSDVISYDYSGYGCSTGSPSEEEMVSDLECVLEFCTNTLNINLKNIILFGNSVGSIPTISMGRMPRYSQCICGIILLSPFICLNSSSKLDKEKKKTRADSDFYDMQIGQVLPQALLIHGLQDRVTIHERMYGMSKIFRDVFIWYPRKGDHYNIPTLCRRKFYQKIKDFLDFLWYHKSEESLRSSLMTSKREKKKFVKIDTFKNYINYKGSLHESIFQEPSVRMYTEEEKKSQINDMSRNQRTLIQEEYDSILDLEKK